MKRVVVMALVALAGCATNQSVRQAQVSDTCRRLASIIASGDPDDKTLESRQYEVCMRQEFE